LAQQNRDKVIVFKGHRYGIFDTHELMVLAGIPVQDLPTHLGFGVSAQSNGVSGSAEALRRSAQSNGSRADILRRYGCLPNSP
jgi:hypothetical protein